MTFQRERFVTKSFMSADDHLEAIACSLEGCLTPKVWFITGTSSGFGRRLVSLVLARGDRVIATARKSEDLEKLSKECLKLDPRSHANLRTLQVDVTDSEEVMKEKAQTAKNLWGTIDVLVNNAGIGFASLAEEGGLSLLRTQFETNVYGVANVTLAILPIMRAQRSGTIVTMGSRSTWRAAQGLYAYSASKAAVHAFMENLSLEVTPFNIRVLLVTPGSFRTEGVYSRPWHFGCPISDYDALRSQCQEQFSMAPELAQGDPDKAMRALVDVVRGEGVAMGRHFPGYFILGKDAEEDVKNRTQVLLEHLLEWRDVTRGVSVDA